MPFDPTKPTPNSLILSQELRDQFNGLKDLIDAVPAGPEGPPGPEGPAGPQGPLFATVQVTSVTTGAPGTPAEVVVNTNANDVMLDFTIPQGEPGEVTQQQMNDAIAYEIAATARNPDTVAPLGISISNPPTQADVQAIMNKVNELLAGLLR